MSKWTQEEVAILKKRYSNDTKDTVASLLSNHSWHAIQNKAHKLGVSNAHAWNRKFNLSKEELYQLYWEKGLSQYKIADILGISQQTVSEWMIRLGIERRKKYSLIEPDLSVSYALCYILGALIGDGTVCYAGKGHYRIQLEVIAKPFALSFYKALKVIKLKPYINQRKTLTKGSKHLLWYVQANSKVFYDWYTKLTFEEIAGLAKKFPKHFIRGFYEAEGNFNKYHPKDCAPSYFDLRWTLANKDKKWLLLIRALLLEMGYHPSRVYKRRTGSDVYILGLYRNSEVRSILDSIMPCIKNG